MQISLICILIRLNSQFENLPPKSPHSQTPPCFIYNIFINYYYKMSHPHRDLNRRPLIRRTLKTDALMRYFLQTSDFQIDFFQKPQHPKKTFKHFRIQKRKLFRAAELPPSNVEPILRKPCPKTPTLTMPCRSLDG